MSNKDIDTSIFTMIAGFTVSFFNQYGILSLLVCSVVILDVVTGILKAKISQCINSNTGYKGFWKKLSLFVGLFFGYFLDFFELYLISINDIFSVTYQIPFGTIIGVYIILNESISVIENLYACGIKLPSWIEKTLQVTKMQIKDSKIKK